MLTLLFSVLDQSAKGGGAERAAPDFEAHPKLESSSKSPSSIRHFSRVLLFGFVSLSVSARVSGSSSLGPQTGVGSAAVPISFAHVRVGGESALFMVSELEST